MSLIITFVILIAIIYGIVKALMIIFGKKPVNYVPAIDTNGEIIPAKGTAVLIDLFSFLTSCIAIKLMRITEFIYSLCPSRLANSGYFAFFLFCVTVLPLAYLIRYLILKRHYRKLEVEVAEAAFIEWCMVHIPLALICLVGLAAFVYLAFYLWYYTMSLLLGALLLLGFFVWW